MEEHNESLQSLVTRLYDAAVKGDAPSLLNLLQNDPLIFDQWIVDKLDKFRQASSHVPANLVAQLLNAALKGDVPSLLNLLQEDPLILERCMIQKSGCFMQSPLHIAVNAGHLEFTTEILRHKPELAEELDHLKGSSPLHIASARGHLEIVKTLLAVKHNICFTRDREGRNSVHIAAINGQIHVLHEFLRAKPEAARERTNGGETVLHLCMKHNQPEALRFLIDVTDDGELLNSKDSDDNTVLHLAVAAKQLEIVKFLLKHKRMRKSGINRNGSTAMDVLIQSRKGENDREIWKALKGVKALRAKDTLKPQDRHRAWLEKQNSALMVVACLIATMAFQVGINPPGGVWQENTESHTAGTSIMADTDQLHYDKVLISNTIGLVSSLSVILLLISGLPCKRLFVVILMITMWIAVTSTTITYYLSVTFAYQSPYNNHNAVWSAIEISITTWIFLMLILLHGNTFRIIVKLVRQLVHLGVKLHARATNRPPV